MSKNIRFKNKRKRRDAKETDETDAILPIFVLCLRDFSLEMKKDDKDITPDEYLENALTLKPGDDTSKGNINKQNANIRSIRTYFPTRKCFTFDRPGNRKKMQMLDKMPLDQLEETFVEETERFLQYMYDRSPKVLLHSKPLTGSMFAWLVETYMNDIENGAVPDVDNAFAVVANKENERLAEALIKQFRDELNAIPLPYLKTKDYESLYQTYQTKQLQEFRQESVFDVEKTEKKLREEMDNIWREKKEANFMLVKNHCEEVLDKMYKEKVGEQLEAYAKAGGYLEYKANLANFKSAYKTNMEETDENTVLSALTDFVNKKTETENQIMLADQKLSAEERLREMERLHKENAEALQRQQEAFALQLQAERKSSEEHARKLEEERKEHQKKEEERFKQLMDSNDKRKEIELRTMELMLTNENAKMRSVTELKQIVLMSELIGLQRKDQEPCCIQ